MRTTLTLDDAIARSLKKLAHESDKPFKQVVNEVLLRGLSQPAAAAPRRYRLEAASLGQPAPGVNLDKALTLADALEDQAICDKLEQRK